MAGRAVHGRHVHDRVRALRPGVEQRRASAPGRPQTRARLALIGWCRRAGRASAETSSPRAEQRRQQPAAGVAGGPRERDPHGPRASCLLGADAGTRSPRRRAAGPVAVHAVLEVEARRARSRAPRRRRLAARRVASSARAPRRGPPRRPGVTSKPVRRPRSRPRSRRCGCRHRRRPQAAASTSERPSASKTRREDEHVRGAQVVLARRPRGRRR